MSPAFCRASNCDVADVLKSPTIFAQSGALANWANFALRFSSCANVWQSGGDPGGASYSTEVVPSGLVPGFEISGIAPRGALPPAVEPPAALGAAVEPPAVLLPAVLAPAAPPPAAAPEQFG